ncbi:hypothetical protein GKC29_11940 [Micromonospora sp. WMMC415]|uniref:hypothetical protein n=1 Tax=Micromonospora sp. WMMC415 TaxID=2675222 RepID=UPI0012B4DE1D|nr:hypothetical protein [Micromonospora sp. WMMC415]QGN47481.1 hypothetical protein GKC29_11940 [Micromonospora sp. WMMC415]
MNGRLVALGVLLGLGGLALALAAGTGLLAGDLAALPVVVLGAGLAGFGAVVVRAGARAPAPRTAGARRGGAFGVVPGPAGDVGADYRHRDHGDGDDPGDWSSGGGSSDGDSGRGSSGGDSGGGWFFGGGDSGGGGWSSGGGGDSGGGGGSW